MLKVLWIEDRFNLKSLLVPPAWTQKPPKDIEVISGNSLELPCLASGSPKPLIIWKREAGK